MPTPKPSIVDRLLEECLLTRSDQQAARLERVCRDNPEHAPDLRERYELLQEAGLLMTAVERPAQPATETGAALTRFGEFELVREIGRGGMGLVYLAAQPSMNRRVALKLIRLDYLNQERARVRFQREVAAVSSLDHPGICTVYEAGEVDGTPYIAMRYIEGETLAQRIATARETGDNTTSEKQTFATIALIEKVALALHHAHESGLIHRDVKPGNIIVTPDEAPVLLDFGLARFEESSGDSLTMTGDAIGTPAYMSPEQISPAGRLMDRRTDVYSLAVTLFESLTLRAPFAAPTREGLYRQILHGGRFDASTLQRAMPRDLQIVLATAMERDPQRRYATAQAFADDLRRVRLLQPITVRSPSRAERLWRWTRREPLKATIAVAVPMLALVSGYLLASLDSITAGDHAIQRQRLDQALTRGFSRLYGVRPDDALRHFAAAKSIAPENLDADAGRVLALLDLDRFDEATTRLAKMDSGRNAVQRLQAWTLFRSGYHDEGRQAMAKIPPAEDRTDLFVHGRIAIANGFVAGYHDFSRAADLIHRAILLSPVARLHYRVAMATAAIELQDSQQIRAAIDSLAKLWPDDPTAMTTVARGLSHLDLERALETCHTVKKRWPDHHLIDAVLGDVHQKRGDEAAAELAYRAAIDTDAATHRDHRSLIRLLLGENRRTEAELVASRGAARWVGGPCLVGMIYRSAELWDSARRAFDQQLAQRPDHVTAHAELGFVSLREGELEAAERSLRTALSLDAKCVLAHRYLGDLRREQGRPEAAESAYRRALQLDPTCDEAARNLGRLLVDRGSLLKARPLYADLVRRLPVSAADHYGFGCILLRLGEQAAAERAFRKTIRLAPDHAEAYCNLAQMIAREARAQEAVPLLRRGHELGSARQAWAYPSEKWLTQVEQLAARERELEKMLARAATPKNAATIFELAYFAYGRGSHEAAVRLYRRAFRIDPRSLAGSRRPHGFYAACCAALTANKAAGAGEVRDGEVRDLVGAALSWLRAELDELKTAPLKSPADRKKAFGTLRSWLLHADLAVLRESAMLNSLSADQRQEVERFWAEVREVQRRCAQSDR